MTAYPTDKGYFIPDLRTSHDDCVRLRTGMLYRREKIVQVWWKEDVIGRKFIPAEIGRETWTMPSVEEAERAFFDLWVENADVE